MTELIGWTASVVLIATLSAQIRKQWRARRTEAVSRWLFVGQLAANVLFITYSALLGNWVFIVTNAALAVTSITGLVLLLIHRHRERSGPATHAGVTP
jgi:MtN3 and saliva related transmembrane protein